jgi:osmotically-inducible protein OsmY
MIQEEEIAMKTDARLQEDVMNELKWEPTIHAAEIGVAVKHGVVTLSGSVDSYAKKWAAHWAAKRVLGVKAVADEIKVTPSPSYKRADKDIAETARKVLDWNFWIPNRVKVMVKDGRLTLSGDVDWYYQKERAEDAVRHLVGVLAVINSITIKPAPMQELQVKNRIEDALKRNARLLLAAQKIQVETSGSKVILRGTVGSLTEYEDAEYAAWAAPGVSEVENKLIVTD